MRAVTDFDIVFLSYDEPMADRYFDHLVDASPRQPLRVHGVKGFDRALKTAASQSKTSRFVTVDADNLVRPEFFATEIDDTQPSDLVYSYNARNLVTGLIYGNGSIKIWPRDLVLKLNTHENSANGNHDFCWTYRYWQVNQLASDVNHAQSPFHAFRAAYREAVKLSLIQDIKAPDWATAVSQIYPPNLSRLLIWAAIGSDCPFGIWSIWGARFGLFDLWVSNIDPSLITDFTWLDKRWRDLGGSALAVRQKLCMESLVKLGFELPTLDSVASRWFKQAYINPPREDGYMLPGMLPPA